jgi:hypothetical protein
LAPCWYIFFKLTISWSSSSSSSSWNVNLK